ncbi:MAG: hypothetical protein OSJ83_11185, partial [Clostridia bacterium]|nr:hypothetical protein [Clostridia bacterium]
IVTKLFKQDFRKLERRFQIKTLACDFKDLIPLYVRESQAEKDLKESGANARIQSSDSRR